MVRPGFTLIELFAAVLVVTALASMILPALGNARESARKVTCQTNLAQLTMALHNYHAAHGMLPPGCVNESGPFRTGNASANHFGWIVQILPQLDEASIWRQLDFTRTSYDQPAIAAQKMPEVLRCPSSAAFGSSYAGCHRDTPAPIDVDDNGVMFLNSSIRFREITDGLAHTLAIGEIQQNAAVGVWYQGTDATLCHSGSGIAGIKKLGQSAPFAGPDTSPGATAAVGGIPISLGIGSLHGAGANVALVNGSVRFVSEEVDAGILLRLGNRHDGEVIGDY